MKDSKDIFKLEKEFLLQTYKRIPIEISRGKGVYLYSSDGKKYLDFFSGLAVNALGYGNEKLIQAVEEQLKKYLHLSNFYVSRTQIELAEKLIKYSGLNKVFFSKQIFSPCSLCLCGESLLMIGYTKSSQFRR